MQKTFFVFLMAVAIALPLATAYNCTALDSREEKRICRYIEDQDWSQSEKDSVIQDMVDNGGSLDGDFESIIGNSVPEIQLNEMQEASISKENKEFLIDFSSFSIFGYILYAFVKRYYLLWSLL